MKNNRGFAVDASQWLPGHHQRACAIADGSKKANLDVEIAVDMIALVGCYDTAILVSGDGDLAYAVDAVSYRGVRVEVVSLRSMTSDSLINVADRYIDLEGIRTEIQKASRSGYTYRPLSGITLTEPVEAEVGEPTFEP